MLWVTRIGQGPINFGWYARWKWTLTEMIFVNFGLLNNKRRWCNLKIFFKWTMSQAPKTRIGTFSPGYSRFSIRALHLLMMQKEQKLLWPSLRSLCISMSRNPKWSKNSLSPTKFFRHLDPRGPTFSFPFSLPKPTLAAKTFFIVAK